MTAERWQDQLTRLGYRVEIQSVDETVDADALVADRKGASSVLGDADLVIALHARRCAAAVEALQRDNPHRPLIVALAGTDLYQDLPDDASARRSLDLADRLVVLTEDGLEHLQAMKPAWRLKAHVVEQSVTPTQLTHRPHADDFVVLVLSYLRDVKDPLLAAAAARDLPAKSRVRVLHAGAAHNDEWAQRASEEATTNPRYEWLGEIDALSASELLAAATVLACTSKLEGGANVVSEAIAMGVPVIGTDIGGNRGLLGKDHPALVPVGNVSALAQLLARLESNPAEVELLQQRSLDRQWMTDPANERQRWEQVLALLPDAG